MTGREILEKKEIIEGDLYMYDEEVNNIIREFASL